MWKAIPSYENIYEANSDTGDIRSLDRIVICPYRDGRRYRKRQSRILKPSQDTNGYLQIKLYNNTDRQKSFSVHSIILLTFIGARPIGFEINHKNGCKTDNRLCNLEYCSTQENNRHALEVLKHNPNRKLSIEQVLWIRDNKYNYSHKQMALIFCVCLATISRILSYRMYNSEEYKTGKRLY